MIATLRHRLIGVPARLVRHARGITLRLPPEHGLLAEVLARIRALPQTCDPPTCAVMIFSAMYHRVILWPLLVTRLDPDARKVPISLQPVCRRHSGADLRQLCNTGSVGCVSEIVGWLRADGHDTFLDRDAAAGIGAGDEWRQRLYRELRRVDAVVSVVTSASAQSSWCAAELGIADAMGCLVIPLRVSPDSHPLLEHRQYVDYCGHPDAARVRVLEALRHLDNGLIVRRWRDGDNPSPASSRSHRGRRRCSSDARARSAISAISCDRRAAGMGESLLWSARRVAESHRCSTRACCRCWTASRAG